MRALTVVAGPRAVAQILAALRPSKRTMQNHFAFILVLLAGLVLPGFLPNPAHAQSSEAFTRLRDASRFAPGGVSVDNHRAEELSDLDAIAAQGTAELERLFREATTTEGKLYALLGLYAVDRPRYEALSQQLAGAERVRLQAGCMGYPVTVRDALADIEGPLTRFPRP